MEAKEITEAAKALTFITAGRARVTFVSKKTGKRFTYRVASSKDKAVKFVSVLTGSDNEGDYTFAGTIMRDGAFRPSPKSEIAPDAPSVKGFGYAWAWLSRGELPPGCEIHHEGRCGRCGRALTVPESIEAGIGPECAQYM